MAISELDALRIREQRNAEKVMVAANMDNNFDRIIYLYFPQWNTRREWKLAVVDQVEALHGRCDIEPMTIYVHNHADTTLIHEICHAIHGPGHNKKWQERMKKVAEDAEAFGYGELAKDIIDDIERASITVNPQIVYDKIYEMALMNGSSYEVVIFFVSRSFDMSLSEFKAKFKKAEQVYNDGLAARVSL